MAKSESNDAKLRGRQIYDISTGIAWMSYERAMLQDAGHHPSFLKLPLCQEKDVADIRYFFPRARIGFTQAIRSEHVTRPQIQDILRHTTPPNTRKQRLENLSTNESQNNLPEFWQVVDTLSILIQRGDTCFNDFTQLPDSNMCYSLSEAITFWNIDPSLENVWEILNKLGTTTEQALYLKEEIDRDQLLRLSHFFTAGREIASVFAQ
jgi:hypothetical protein